MCAANLLADGKVKLFVIHIVNKTKPWCETIWMCVGDTDIGS